MISITRTDETTIRTLTFKVEGEIRPLSSRKYGIDVNTKRSFFPETITIRIVDGEFRSITLAGPRALASGQAHTLQRDSAQWDRRDLARAPAWVRTIAQEGREAARGWRHEVVAP